MIYSPNEKIRLVKDAHLGELEELALLIIVALGQDAYGVAVQKRLERDAHRPVALGAVYAAIGRLERKRYVRSSMGDATPQRGGRRKRMYAATPDGLKALRDVRRTREHLWRLADATGGK